MNEISQIKNEPAHFDLNYQQTMDFYAEAMGGAFASGGPEAYNEVRAELGRTDLFFLLVFILRMKIAMHPWIFARCREVQREPNDRLDLWAREHFKSTVITFALTIFDIINDPEITVGIFSHTKSIARDFLKQIKTELEMNEDLWDLYPDVFYREPQKNSPRWSVDGGIVVKRTQNPKEATVEGHGLVDGMPTGRHFKLKVYDDVVTKEGVNTPEQIHKTTEAFQMSDNLGSEGGHNRYIGTRYHLFDTYSVIIDQKIAIPRIHAATYNGKEHGIPVLLSRETLATKRLKQGPYVYSSQMLLNPVADASMGFKLEWIIKQDIEYNTAMKRLWRFIIVDPAGGKQRTGNDYTTMLVIGYGEDGKYRVLDMRRDRMRLTQRADTLIELHKKWKPQLVAYEEYGMQADIEHIQFRQKQDLYEFAIHPLGGNMNKKLRILRLVPYFEGGRIILPTYLHQMDYQDQLRDLVKDFIEEEYTAFPVLKHDDMCFIAGTMIATNKGDIPIELIKNGDMVLTPDGFRMVVNSGFTGLRKVISKFGLTGTPEHPIFSIENSYKRLDTLSSINETIGLKLCDWIKIALLKLSCSTERNSDAWEEVADIISLNQQRMQGARTLKGFMSLFGSIFQGKSAKKVMKLITRMVILLTVSLRIWSVYQKACIVQSLKELTWTKSEKTLKFKDQRLPNGTNPQKEENGILNTLKRRLKRFLSPEAILVSNVQKSFQQESLVSSNTVLTSAEKDIEENLQKVYNITVADAHCYFANGILVHNCDCLSRIEDLVAEKLIQTPIITNVNPESEVNKRLAAAMNKVQNGSKPTWIS